MQFTKNDIYILNSILKNGGENELKSVSISTITKDTELSHTKVRATIKVLASGNYIKEGFMQKNAKTYFITDEGKEMLTKLLS